MIKKLFIFLIFGFLFLNRFVLVLAENDYESASNTEYKVLESGTTLVTSTISIKNAKSNFYPKIFVLNLDSINPQNIKAYETGRKLKVNIQKLNNTTTLEVNFESASIGKGVQKTFVVTYQTDSLVKKSGEVWEISIPKIINPDFYTDYKISLSTPGSWGNSAYISPTPKEVKEIGDRYVYNFDKDNIKNTQILAGFGKFQTFNFSLKYNLENTTKEKVTKEIALPPDTSTQTVYYDSIDPRPNDIRLDSDGNWLASYNLEKGEKLVIHANGAAQIYGSPRTLDFRSDKPIESLLLPNSYWQSDNVEIKRIANELKTPEAIYNYVVNKLKYDYSRIGPNYNRLGAEAVLNNTDKALCMEFTDLFIAIARAAGIPAREINGFAYSKDMRVEPLSLVTDVLHSWPEYWNEKNKTWVPIDPTWGSTTGGTDFFNKLDLNHLAFVIHGQSPVLPHSVGSYKLSGNPEKDIIVTFGQITGDKFPFLKLTYKTRNLFPFLSKKAIVTVQNTGKSAIYNVDLSISGHPGTIEKNIINVIPPFSSHTREIKINYGILASSAPDYFSVKANDSEITIEVNKTQAIIYQLITLFMILIAGLLIFQYNHKMNSLNKKDESET